MVRECKWICKGEKGSVYGYGFVGIRVIVI